MPALWPCLGLWTASLVVLCGIQIAMYLTPVAYSSGEIARKFPDWMWLYQLNPMYWVIEGFRWCLFNIGTPPQWYMLLPVLLTPPPPPPPPPSSFGAPTKHRRPAVKSL